MHTVMNVYIGNLALADVIIALFCIPFQFQAALLNRWDLPAFMCKLCPFLQVSISTYNSLRTAEFGGICESSKGHKNALKSKVFRENKEANGRSDYFMNNST